MIKLTLTLPDAQFLRKEIARLAQHLDNELVHTDARAMQHSLARDVKRLEEIGDALERAIDAGLDFYGVSTAREMR